jgi:hypothetical protein
MEWQRVTLAAAAVRRTANGSLVADDCPFYESGPVPLDLYPVSLVTRPFLICFCCGVRGSFAANADGSYTSIR